MSPLTTVCRAAGLGAGAGAGLVGAGAGLAGAGAGLAGAGAGLVGAGFGGTLAIKGGTRFTGACSLELRGDGSFRAIALLTDPGGTGLRFQLCCRAGLSAQAST